MAKKDEKSKPKKTEAKKSPAGPKPRPKSTAAKKDEEE